MAKPLRPKRGTTAQNDAFTGLESEITIDKEKNSIRVHDGVTAGGHEILPKEQNDELYAPKGLDVGVTSVNGQTGDVTVDAGVSSVNGNTGDITPEQTGCLPLSGGTMTGTNIGFAGVGTISSGSSSSEVAIRNGSSASQGGGIWLYGNDSNGGGKVRIQVYDKANSKYRVFDVKPDGTMTWDGNNLLAASAYSANNYIKLSNGLQICFGSISTSASSSVTTTFGRAFSSAPKVTYSGGSLVTSTSVTATSITWKPANTTSQTLYYIAIGVGS